MGPTNGPVRDGREPRRRVSRRGLLQAGGAALATAGLAGCTFPRATGNADMELQDCPIDVSESESDYRTHPNDDVTMWRGGLRRLGYYPDETIPDAVSVNYSFPINYRGHTAAKSSPVPTPDGETILFAGDTGRIDAYTPRGSKQWTTQTGATHLGFHGSPTVVGDVAYFGGYDGDLYALNVNSGEILWNTTSDDFGGTLAIGSGPAYYEGILYVIVEYANPSSGALWAVDAETGHPLFSDDDIWGQAHPSPTIDLEHERLLAGSNDGAVYCWKFPCLERAWTFQTGPKGSDGERKPTGEEKADGEFHLGAEVKGTAPTFDGYAYIGSWDDHIYCLDIEDGEEVWTFETGGIVMSNPGADPNEGIVYAGSGDGYVYALDGETGEELWSADVNGTVLGGVTVTEETVLAGSYDTHLYALDKETGERRWRVENRGHVTSAAVPIDGRIYYAERGVIDGYWDDDEDEVVREPGHAYCLVPDE